MKGNEVIEMKKNNIGKKLKATVAVILVVASLFAMTSFVSAGVVERILGDEYAHVVVASSSNSGHVHSFYGNGIDRGQKMCEHGYAKIYQCSCGEKRVGCTSCNPDLLK